MKELRNAPDRLGFENRAGLLMIGRSDPKITGMIERFQMSEFQPATIDNAARSIAVVAATEAPATVYDPERWEAVEEILLMSGCQIPAENSIPLTVEHSRNAEDVIGSLRDMKIEGDQLVGRVYFSAADDAEQFWTKTREGHLKRFSITYPAAGRESVYIAENQTATVAGKIYTGPLLVTTKWQPKALGLVLFAADDRATARAASNHENQKEIDTMDPKLRKFLERSGLPATATEAEAWAYMDTLDVQRAETPATAAQAAAPAAAIPAADTADVERAADKARKQERERITEINALCGRFGLDDMAVRGVADGKTLAQMQTEVLSAMAERKDPGYRPAQVITDARDKFRSAALDGMMIRAAYSVDKPSDGSRDIAGWTLVEIARHCLGLENLSTGGSRIEMVGRAMLSTDFPILLANVANKSLFDGWQAAEETWRIWCAVGSVNDFKLNSAARRSEFDDLEEIVEHEEYKYGKFTEAQETFKIATYGKIFAITRQAIINDDLGAMTDTPKSMGEAAARKVGDLPYAVLTANAAMGDGVALFNAAHANYVAHGSGAGPGVATVGAGVAAMGVQKDLQGLKRLNINAKYFIAPRALETSSEVFFMSQLFSDANTVATDSSFATTRHNPYSGSVLTRVYESRLDGSDVKAWYLAAAKGKTVTVFFLGGVQAPYLESRQGWTVDGVENKVRIDAAAKAMDWRGLYNNNGD